MIIENIDTRQPQFILIRGVPGSGKSTLGKILNENFGFEWFEADMWFYEKFGQYLWSKENAITAHEWCFSKFKRCIDRGLNVVISNTFIKKSQMERYINYANENAYKITILRARGKFKNIHYVPDNTLQRMKKEFEE